MRRIFVQDKSIMHIHMFLVPVAQTHRLGTCEKPDQSESLVHLVPVLCIPVLPATTTTQHPCSYSENQCPHSADWESGHVLRFQHMQG